MRRPGFMMAAPASGSGKTVVTLALLRAMRTRGRAVRSFKAGPDFIDPAFHAVASGAPCCNLDPWAMRPELLQALVAEAGTDAVVVEAMMGLYDGAADGSASAASLARSLGLPVVLVVDAGRQSHSIAALVHGFATFRNAPDLVGVVLNRVGSPRHEAMLRGALSETGMPVLGCIPRSDALALPSRHLGLVQACENVDLEAFVDSAATLVSPCIDWPALDALMVPSGTAQPVPPAIEPPAQRIAVASDLAFAFAYPHVLEGWRKAGAEVSHFSPLADQAPSADCGAVFLPGGYPELHAGRIASNTRFLGGLRAAAAQNLPVYGECGGYMVLGQGLTDAAGERHGMAGLLPVETSFATPKRTLGYRNARLVGDCAFLAAHSHHSFAAHEFHYSVQSGGEDGSPLFDVEDATGQPLGLAGARQGSVAGSYLHIIDRRDGA